MRKTMLAVAFVSVVIAASSYAQTVTPRVDKREARQQARIRQGVKSGELTGPEAAKLERQQGRIRRDESRAKADGVVTPKERARLAREQNRASKNIHAKKHNNRVQ